MKTIGDVINDFSVIAVRPGFNDPQENDVSAFEIITQASFSGKWKVFYFYPKDFTFVCPTEIVEFGKLAQAFALLNAVLLGGNSDNEFVKLAWRKQDAQLDRLNHYVFSDPAGVLIDQLGIRDKAAGVGASNQSKGSRDKTRSASSASLRSSR